MKETNWKWGKAMETQYYHDNNWCGVDKPEVRLRAVEQPDSPSPKTAVSSLLVRSSILLNLCGLCVVLTLQLEHENYCTDLLKQKKKPRYQQWGKYANIFSRSVDTIVWTWILKGQFCSTMCVGGFKIHWLSKILV